MKAAFKFILSYLWPVTLKHYDSRISGNLEINLVNGRRVLDTKTTNYSFGSLQRILRRGLSEIRFGSDVDKVLVLGLGAGSIVETIREDFGSDAFIELVDIDPKVIEIAQNEFGIGRYSHIHLVQEDALKFVQCSSDHYDVIIVDLFIIDVIPKAFTEPPFIAALLERLSSSGKMVFNTLNHTMSEEVRNAIRTELSRKARARLIRNVESTNTLIIAEKSL